MSEQQMANYTLTIQADSGYESTTEGRCTAEQYGQAMAALHGTSPAQHTWVGLTDDEIYSVLENLQVIHHRPPTTDSRVIFALAIEAKLKEKNT